MQAVVRSIFRLVPFMTAGMAGRPASALRTSGLPHPVRRQALAEMTHRLAEKRDLTNMFEQVWDEMEARWPDGSMADRRQPPASRLRIPSWRWRRFVTHGSQRRASRTQRSAA